MTLKHEPRFCDGPACDNDVGLFLLAGVAVTGDALGDRAFCCECCAEEWLDWIQDRAETVFDVLETGGSRRSAVIFTRKKMNQFSKLIVDLSEAVSLVQGVSAKLAECNPPVSAFNPLAINGYVLPVPPPDDLWYIAGGHTWSLSNTQGHTGLDINLLTGGDSDLGHPVRSTCNGLVVYARRAPGVYWGNIVVVQSIGASGILEFWRYAHLDEIRTFEGAVLRAGDELGTIGKGGQRRYWEHLHLDLWEGAIQNAAAYRNRNARWTDPLNAWKLAGYIFNWGVRT